MKIDCLPIDERIKEILKRQGIVELYPPQAEALPYALEGKNVVLSVPTAAGKSLVAYISVLQSALKGERSLYIVPLRALAREKYEDLLEFEEIGVKIGISTGDLDEKGGYLSKYDIVVCTSEKADSLLRHKAEWMNEVKIIVADEIHLINDGSRGPTLEVNLARFMLMKPVQIIALSATIKNAYKIAEWLDAVLIESEWRPVPLKEGILLGKSIDFLNDGIKKLGKSGIEGLIEDVLSQNGQALIFVNTRRSAQSTALKLAEITEKYVERKAEEISHKILRDEGINIISKKLALCVERGIAFHHAGLSSNQRREIEKAFKKGIIKCIVATPTLAAGVNTPARRVIIKNLWRYSDTEGYMIPIPVMEIKQMMGRAGRPGYDEEGEAILVARNKIEKERILKEYLLADVEPVYSKLASESALRMHILSLIATEFAVYWEEIIDFFKKTFYAHQLGIVPEEKIWEIIDFLERNEFIESHGERWRPTLFGHKTAELYLDPLSALKMRTALEGKTGNNFSYLHAVCSTPDMNCLFLNTKDSWIEEKIKEEKFLFEVPSPFDIEYEWFMAEVKTASLLEDWIEEKKEDYIITKYQVGPGDIHNKVERAEWLIYSMQELARIFNFGAVPILSKLKMRVKYGCKEELLNLVKLHGIGRVRARILYKNGFKSISTLRRASVETLAQLPGIGINIAKQIKEQVE
ncbi:MAG TPA: DEAD/DEAH box helicase [Thermoplasmatales archaeon]|nr:DEAD/DEAH box helicase [Thermoplasmatales archaeon]